jgi:hypothetical protein
MQVQHSWHDVARPSIKDILNASAEQLTYLQNVASERMKAIKRFTQSCNIKWTSITSILPIEEVEELCLLNNIDQAIVLKCLWSIMRLTLLESDIKAAEAARALHNIPAEDVKLTIDDMSYPFE